MIRLSFGSVSGIFWESFESAFGVLRTYFESISGPCREFVGRFSGECFRRPDSLLPQHIYIWIWLTLTAALLNHGRGPTCLTETSSPPLRHGPFLSNPRYRSGRRSVQIWVIPRAAPASHLPRRLLVVAPTRPPSSVCQIGLAPYNYAVGFKAIRPSRTPAGSGFPHSLTLRRPDL